MPLSGPFCMEDPSDVKRRAISDGSVGPAGSGRTPSKRSSRTAISIFAKAKSAEKAFKELATQGMLEEGSVAGISDFFLRNDGKLDLAKVGDFLGGGEELNKQAGRTARTTHGPAMREPIAGVVRHLDAQRVDCGVLAAGVRGFAVFPRLCGHATGLCAPAHDLADQAAWRGTED